jgi:hypothetical protein
VFQTSISRNLFISADDYAFAKPSLALQLVVVALLIHFWDSKCLQYLLLPWLFDVLPVYIVMMCDVLKVVEKNRASSHRGDDSSFTAKDRQTDRQTVQHRPPPTHAMGCLHALENE